MNIRVSRMIAVASLLWSGGILSQELQLPREPIDPISMARCSELEADFFSVIAPIKDRLNACYEVRSREPWGGVRGDGTCASLGPRSCYGLIDACDAVNQRRQQSVNTCRTKVASHLARTREQAVDERRMREEAAFDSYASVARSYASFESAWSLVEDPGGAVARSFESYLGRGLLDFVRAERPPAHGDRLDTAKYDWVHDLADALGRSVHRSPVTGAIFAASMDELSRQHRDFISSLYAVTEAIASFSVSADRPALQQALPVHLVPQYDSAAAASAASTEEIIGLVFREPLVPQGPTESRRAEGAVVPAIAQPPPSVSPNCNYNRAARAQYLEVCAQNDGCALRASMDAIVAESC